MHKAQVQHYVAIMARLRRGLCGIFSSLKISASVAVHLKADETNICGALRAALGRNIRHKKT